MKLNGLLIMLGAVLWLGGCGTDGIDTTPNNGAVEDGSQTVTKSSDREIIAELKQTVQKN